MSMRTLPLRWTFCVLLGLLAYAPCAWAQSRGELLYATHCIACHSSQMHWRDNRIVTDWTSLLAQVRRWQGAASLGWSESDIEEVARHLNQSIYRFAPSSGPMTSIGPCIAATRESISIRVR